MQNALESLSKAELIALLQQREAHYNHRLEEKNTTIQDRDAIIQEKERQIAKLQRMLYGLGGPVRNGSALSNPPYSCLWTLEISSLSKR